KYLKNRMSPKYLYPKTNLTILDATALLPISISTSK